eukprot:GGOE01023189.1.p1 GENE.GGOE01023189.1~~GGOE01023189.1.p1  ORF type:complete len:257 (-),score=39.72 GGOE01023189.1:209-979(-)
MDEDDLRNFQRWCQFFVTDGGLRRYQIGMGTSKSQVATALYEELTAADGYGRFERWLDKQSIDPVLVQEQQFLTLLGECSGWPSFKLLDLFDSVDVDEQGEVPARTCYTILCLWLAKEAGQCTSFWRTFQPVALPLVYNHVEKPEAEESLFTDLASRSTRGARALEWLSLVGGWAPTDIPASCLDKWDGQQLGTLYTQFFEEWDKHQALGMQLCDRSDLALEKLEVVALSPRATVTVLVSSRGKPAAKQASCCTIL